MSERTAVREILAPLGWTRQSNIDGFVAGTYDVIGCWQACGDPNWDQVGVYTEQQVDQIIDIILKAQNE